MTSRIDLARHFLALAEHDLRAFHKLVDDPNVDEATVGFLAQQAVEKCLKAVLARHDRPVIACCAITSSLAGEYEESGSVSPGSDQAPAPPQAPGWSAWIARSPRRSGMVLAEVDPD